jgi:hypothetical protein
LIEAAKARESVILENVFDRGSQELRLPAHHAACFHYFFKGVWPAQNNSRERAAGSQKRRLYFEFFRHFFARGQERFQLLWIGTIVKTRFKKEAGALYAREPVQFSERIFTAGSF